MKKLFSLLLVLCMIASCAVSAEFSAAAQETNDSAAVGELAATGEDYGLPQTIEDGNILHCFNWTLSQIKAELPNIAAAGFTSVQTSPLQAHNGTNKWYWLYQPNGFSTIGNEIGSYSDLQALCTEAHRYGIKVIVDVVANHVAGSNNGSWAGSVESDLKQSKYFHNLGPRNNSEDRYSVTQKNIGMPDLNSENTEIQNRVVAMLGRLKSAGVDGVRWDAAKHIALPSEGCEFWSKMAQVDLFQYGEILGVPAEENTDSANTALMQEYAGLMNVTDSKYSSAVMSAVRDSTTYKTNGYWLKKNIAAGKLVYWAESHDTYANSDGWTKNIDQNVVDKAYALLAARADSQALYLSRPFEKAHESIYYGKKGSTHFTSKEVAAVNHFHNAMVGKDEKVTGTTTYYAVLRTGGAVIVTKGSDTDVSVSNISSMVPEGTYVDEVSGNTFTVSGTKITGHVGTTGIAVIYGAEEPATEYMIGDADLNDAVEIIDVTYIQQSLAKMRTLSAEETAAADADLDGDVTSVDATAIQRHLAGMTVAGSRIGEYTTG